MICYPILHARSISVTRRIMIIAGLVVFSVSVIGLSIYLDHITPLDSPLRVSPRSECENRLPAEGHRWVWHGPAVWYDTGTCVQIKVK
jgi:hypothetical protein